MMTKIYSLIIRDVNGVPQAIFAATLDKARLRAHIARLQGLTPSRPAYMPKFSARIADIRARGQVIGPALRDD